MYLSRITEKIGRVILTAITFLKNSLARFSKWLSTGHLLISLMVPILVAFTLFPRYTLSDMADPVWGLLPKAQDDPTTIDEAIAAAIAAHEADPEAHLGDGESLDVHRANTTLDHPVGAVLSDKNSWTEIIFNEPFTNLDLWNVLGSVDLTQYPQVQFDAVNSLTASKSIQHPEGSCPCRHY